MVNLIQKVWKAVKTEVNSHYQEKVKSREWFTRRCVDCGSGFDTNENIYMTAHGDMHRDCWYGRSRQVTGIRQITA